MWIITLLSFIGVILNIKKRKESFVIWVFTNSVWCIYDFHIGAYAQSGMFAVYTALAVWGIYSWRK